jgi:pimeloyl-ACP methyl ester carboxylesterase
MAFTESFETIAGCRTRFMRAGTGEPLLFLHGAGGAGQWLPFMETLSRRHDLIVPEHPGFGGSDMPDWLDNIADLAFFYLDVIDHFGLERVHLVGTSIGGWIGAEIAVRNQTALATLTLVAPAGIHVKGVKKADVFMWSPEDTVRNLYHDPSIAERLLAVPKTEDEQMVVLKNRLATAKLGWQPRLYNPHLYKWMHRITVPTLILWGAEDRVLPVSYGSPYRDLIPGSRLEVIAGCGHVPQVEKPDEFIRLLASFIEGAAS